MGLVCLGVVIVVACTCGERKLVEDGVYVWYDCPKA